MVRVPPGLHRQAARPGNGLAYRPGWRGSGAMPIRRVPVQAYGARASGVPLTGGQVQGLIPASGTLSMSAGPQGLGNVWYPAQATISTTTGALDTSTCQVYLGSQGVPITLVGTVFPGGAGTVALAVPPLSPGQVLIFTWTGAKPGDIAAANIVGTMDALTTGRSA